MRTAVYHLEHTINGMDRAIKNQTALALHQSETGRMQLFYIFEDLACATSTCSHQAVIYGKDTLERDMGNSF